ncbi:phosphatase PAP2 family protein [Halobacillus aidingensis]|uniref:Undecaprenyl-diphosphatase n=1 Tax=Halobacillus aidingensis TaxID=240303 RepID=A0A1H0KYY4_HALAD|nr:phosphatase PAP2 family protein [Halobacillus aidingensis]SDO61159.1 undecaprenyl-diphosphatase [Halobacillus aidingensis]
MDKAFVSWIYDFSEAEWVDAPMIFFSSWGYKAIIGLFFLLALLKATRKLGLAAIAASLAGLVISRTIRWIAPRERPFAALEEVTPLIEKEASASFPSEQALFVGIFIALLWIIRSRLRWAGLLTGLVILVSRVYLGHHYVSDVLIGAILGGFLYVTISKIFSIKQSFPVEKEKSLIS